MEPANSAVEVAASPERAQYLLIGRATGKGIEYAWLRNNISDSDSKAKLTPDADGNVCSSDSPYPPRTNWVSWVNPTILLAKASETLTEYADRLARVRHGWNCLRLRAARTRLSPIAWP